MHAQRCYGQIGRNFLLSYLMNVIGNNFNLCAHGNQKSFDAQATRWKPLISNYLTSAHGAHGGHVVLSLQNEFMLQCVG